MAKGITVTQITLDDVEHILRLQESWLLDMKGKDITPAKLSRTISAFANNSGGEIYLGISCHKDKTSFYWDGFATLENANEHIKIVDSILGGFDYYNIAAYCPTFLNTIVLHITIQKTPSIIKATDDIPYCRINASNDPCNMPEKVERLKLDKGISTYEDETTSCTFDEISSSKILTDFVNQVVPSSTSYNWLRSQRLMTSETKISVAGVLLYDELPQALLAKRSAIRILRYHTDEKEGTRDTLDDGFPESIEGDIYSLIKNTVKRIISIVEAKTVVGSAKIENKKYPDVVLHELVTNAVLHRDYSILGDIQIRIFTNRIEIESPGRLPGHVTLANILNEQYSRNAKIVRLISKFPEPPNKDAGEGLNTVFAAMMDMKLQKPIIKENENSVVVIVKHERLADAETIVLEYLQSNGTIKNSIARGLTGISDANKMKKVFNRLKEKKMLEKVPGKNSTASEWRLVQVKVEQFSSESEQTTFLT